MSVIIVRGLPGSGKTSVTGVFEERGFAVIHIDNVVAALYGKGDAAGGAHETVGGIAVQAAAYAVNKRRKRILDTGRYRPEELPPIFVDYAFLSRDTVLRFIDALDERDDVPFPDVRIVTLKVAEGERLKRLAGREGGQPGTGAVLPFDDPLPVAWRLPGRDLPNLKRTVMAPSAVVDSGWSGADSTVADVEAVCDAWRIDVVEPPTWSAG
jgi:hypothetical protein